MAGHLVNLLLVALVAAAPFQASSLVRLTGRVVDAATNEPLRGVEISFQRTPSAPGTTSLRAVTRGTGEFSIDIPSGDYSFLVRLPGYVSGKNEVPTSITVRGRAQSMPEIRLEGGGTISGRIVDVRGNPLPRCWSLPCVRPCSERRTLIRLVAPSERMISVSFVCRDCRTAGTMSPRSCCRSRFASGEAACSGVCFHVLPRCHGPVSGVADRSGGERHQRRSRFLDIRSSHAFHIRHCRRRKQPADQRCGGDVLPRKTTSGHLAFRDH